ncbi:MAG TPA: DASS family sodium-coupled anion symporter, partial [Flavisolibacter sp.]
MHISFSKQLTAVICIAVAILIYFINPLGVNPQGAKVIGVASLLIGLWVTEALPMPVTALLPLILFPLLNISPIKTTAASYANEVIFLFMGGFMLGLAIEKWNLHRRIALNIVRLTGTSGNRIILGFIISTGLISMWLSNTATTMMMFPIALSVVKVIEENHSHKTGVSNFATSIMIAIALASNFGGIATLIGTPPNVAYASFISDNMKYTISFADWMLVCMPLAVLLLFIFYMVMVKWLYPNGMKSDETTRTVIYTEIAALGKMSLPEKRVFVIFAGTAFLWITKDLWNSITLLKLDDNMIAIIGATALFITPNGKNKQALLEWKDTSKMAWGILLLFGGGIALASALEKAGLIQSLGLWFSQFSFDPLLLIFLVTLVSLFV